MTLVEDGLLIKYLLLKMLFKYLVQSVMAYRVELWGWEEKGELEKIILDYIRWIFN